MPSFIGLRTFLYNVILCDQSIREQLRRHYHLGVFMLRVEMEHLASYSIALAEQIRSKPAETLPLVCTVEFSSSLLTMCQV